MSEQVQPGYVYHCPQLPLMRLIGLLTEQFPIPGLAAPDRERQRPHYIAHRLEQIDFWYLEPGGAGDVVVNWDEGCVFSPDREVRWRKVGAEVYTVLVLSEEQLNLGEGFQPLGGPWHAVHHLVDQAGLYLWGEHQRDKYTVAHWRGVENCPYWVETRIPQRLFHPAPAAGAGQSRVRVGHHVYLTAGDVPQFVRLAEVQDVAATK